MIKAVKKDTGNVIYMRLMKHNCPVCHNQLKVVRLTKVVKSKTSEANKFSFNVCDMPVGEKVKFIWYEFKCRECDVRFTEAQIKEAEKAERKAQIQKEKEAKKQARKAAKASK